MRTIYNLLEAAKKIDLPLEIELSFFDTREEYVTLQKQQLAAGERNDGKPIFNVKTGSDEYSPAYAKKKGKSKPIDLHDKGDFYFGTFADVREEGIYVDSADDKSEKLQENYGDAIFGLADKRKEPYAEIAVGVLRANIQKKLK